MQIVRDKISVAELDKMSEKMFEKLVKAVVDLEQELMVVDAPMHVDQEFFLLEECDSVQENLWGINLQPQHFGTDQFVVFDSMINLRAWQGNRTRGVENPEIRRKIIRLVEQKVRQ